MTCHKLVQRGSQRVDIGAGRGLSFTVLFRRGIARRAKRGGIPGLPRLEVTRDAKVDQVNMLVRG